MTTSSLLNGLPENVRNDEGYQKLYELEHKNIVSTDDIQHISVAYGSDSFIYISHDEKGDPSEEMHWGYYDYAGKVTSTMPEDLRQDSLWYPNDCPEDIHQYFINYNQ